MINWASKKAFGKDGDLLPVRHTSLGLWTPLWFLTELSNFFTSNNDTIKKIFKVDILNRYEDDFDKRIETMIEEEILCTREDVFNKKLEMTFGKVEKIDNIIEYKLYACARMYLSGLLFVPIDMIEHPDTKSPTPFGQFVRWFLFRAFENLDGVDIFNISTGDCGCRNCE